MLPEAVANIVLEIMERSKPEVPNGEKKPLQEVVTVR